MRYTMIPLIRNQISHRPILDHERVVEVYSKRDGVPITYVCTTELRGDNQPWDVFFRETPHPDFGNRYFGILLTGPASRAVISCADNIEAEFFGMVEWNGIYHYSRYRHDYFTVGAGCMIDGGRAYVRSSGDVTMFRVIDGELVPKVPLPPDEDCPNPKLL